MSIKEDKTLEQIGSNVNINGTNIRVSVSGKGDKTIVLLSGMGTPSPIIDFKPLSKKLSQNYKVVIIEYAGYGLSEDTNEEVTNKVLVEEIRGALKKLDIKPPYILMPHSISGIYCMQYMKMYPDEIEAMIGIESSVPNQAKYEPVQEISNELYYFARFMDITGLSRLSYLNGNALVQDMNSSGSYSDTDIKNVNALISRKSITKAQLSENKNFMNNCKALYDEKYPDNIPILFLLSSDSCKEYEDQNFGVKWDEIHKQVISNSHIQKISYLNGKHYLHWTQSTEIAKQANKFIKNNDNNFLVKEESN